MTTKRSSTPTEDEPVTEQTPAQPVALVLPEPRAGGNYIRDPVTGALSPNPDHLVPAFQPFQE